MEKIYIGTDHAGHEFLKKVTKILDKLNVEYDLIITDYPKDYYHDICFEIAKKVIL